MVASDWNKAVKQLRNKPAVMQKYMRHCKPKPRKTGVSARKCERCGRFGAHIKQYNINLCRQCFREIAEEIGFQKYN